MILRLARWGVGIAVVQSIVLLLLAHILPGFTVGNLGSVVLTAVLITVVEAITWPFLYELSVRIRPALFPVFSFALAGLLILLLTEVVVALGIDQIHVASIGTAILIACGLTAGSTLVSALFSLRDDRAYDWFVTEALRRRYAGTPRSSEPGVLFLEIDGLAEPILRRAITDGWMPTLGRWLKDGSHRLTTWEPDLSSQTSASQAGILLGDNVDIPAFRWFDKTSSTLMVSSRMATARELEHRLAGGEGLLRSGASRWNVFSGEAPDSACTYSTVGVRGRDLSGSYLAYFVNPYTLPRAIALYFGDVVRERWQAWRQTRRNDRPRIYRSWKYALVRAATTTVMQEAALFMLISDVYRGVPVVYNTFFAYDEVAHHSGIDRLDAFKVLGTLDRVFATLERAVASAPRPYQLVVLSDHGQSMGMTFRQRTGQTLGQFVTTLVDGAARVTIDERITEGLGHVHLALSHGMSSNENHPVARIFRLLLPGRSTGQLAASGSTGDAADAALEVAAAKSDAVVLASGNLGLISFPGLPGRLTYEQIVQNFPALIPGLLAQPWVGFVLVHSAAEGGLVIGAKGTHHLDDGHTSGVDPLAVYPANAARHLRRTDGFANAPDLLVMSAYDPTTGEVAAFEELVGSHGGLGGPQTRPFVLHPTELDPGADPIVGAGALHRVLASWLTPVKAGSST